MEIEGHVHEYQLIRSGCEVPDQAIPFVEATLKGRPLDGVGCRVGGWNPNSDDIINEASVVEDVTTTIDAFILVRSETEGCIRRGRGCSHGASAELEPCSVSEGEDVILHDDGKGFHERPDGDVREEARVGTKVAADGTESLVRRDVRIHPASIC
jgi:hypothetical protein